MAGNRQEITQRAQAQQRPSQPVKVQAAAGAVDNLPGYIPSQRDEGVQSLLEGLRSLNPVIDRKLREQYQEDAQQGITDRLGGVEQQSSSWAYKEHYLHTDGLVRGQADKAAIEAAYETEFDKDGGDIESFLRERYQGLTRGLQDGPWLAGYNKQMAVALEGVRKKHTEYQQGAVTQRVESNAMQLLTNGIRAYTMNGMKVPEGYFDSVRDHMGKNLGVSTERFDELTFEAAKSFGNEGNFEVFEELKRDRPDGSPGLYNNPKWKAKIDAAQAGAFNHFESVGRRQRESRIDSSLYSVFDKLYSGDAGAARAEFDGFVKQGLFSNASDRIKWESEFSKVQNKEARQDQQAVELELQAGIYKGGVGFADILKADLTAAQKRSLLGEVRRVRHEGQLLAAQQDKAENAIFKTPEFRSSEDYIKGVLASSASPTDVMGVGSTFDRQQRSAALLEFTQRAAKVQNKDELHAIREEIADRYLKRRQQLTQKGLPEAGRLRYSTPGEVISAAQQRLLSEEEVALHLNYFKAQRNNVR